MKDFTDAVNLIAFIRRKLYLATCLFFVQFPEPAYSQPSTAFLHSFFPTFWGIAAGPA